MGVAVICTSWILEKVYFLPQAYHPAAVTILLPMVGASAFFVVRYSETALVSGFACAVIGVIGLLVWGDTSGLQPVGVIFMVVGGLLVLPRLILSIHRFMNELDEME